MSYRIGAYQIDPAAYEIRSGDAPVPVEPQVLELLVFLIENRTRTVTKDELIDRVWKGRIVSDAALSSRIKAARQALGDDGKAQRLIRTIHGRGFRFVGDVAEVLPPAAAKPELETTTGTATRADDIAPSGTQSKQPVSVLSSTDPAVRPMGPRQWIAIAAACLALVSTAYLMNRLVNHRAGSNASSALKVPALKKPGAPQPRPTFNDCDVCPEMAVVPEGFFLMGSPPEEGRSLMEGPQRIVRFAATFAIGRFEVTVDQFAAFVGATGYKPATQCLVYAFDLDQLVTKPHTFRDPSYYASGTHPAACVSWDDAKAYVAWLARRTGRPYRLPSEAEWEYAARAGTSTTFSFGAFDPATVCEHAKTSDASTRFAWRHAECDSGWGHGAAPVGKHRPNAWGLHDMLGNLWEWVEDCWHANFVAAPSDGSAWTAGGDCAQRVSRGGSWANRPHAVKVAARISYAASIASSNRGFRVALTLGPQR